VHARQLAQVFNPISGEERESATFARISISNLLIHTLFTFLSSLF
jgi:hypothetical protein